MLAEHGGASTCTCVFMDGLYDVGAKVDLLSSRSLYGIKYFEVGTDMEEFIKDIQTISRTTDDILMQYANQSCIVKEIFNVRIWNEWMKKIEEYED